MAYQVTVPGGTYNKHASSNVTTISWTGNPPTYSSGGIKAFRCVSVDTGTGNVDDVILSAAGDNIVGVAMGENVAYGPGDEIPVQFLGVAKIEAGGAITVGDLLSSDSSGRVVDAAAIGATTAYVVGMAETSASEAGDFVSVRLTLGGTTKANA